MNGPKSTEIRTPVVPSPLPALGAGNGLLEGDALSRERMDQEMRLEHGSPVPSACQAPETLAFSSIVTEFPLWATDIWPLKLNFMFPRCTQVVHLALRNQETPNEPVRPTLSV